MSYATEFDRDDLLGRTAVDTISGFTGVVTCISVNLTGCDQAHLQPPVAQDGKKQEGGWFDVTRLEVTDAPRRLPQHFTTRRPATDPGADDGALSSPGLRA
jgi:hypothetical protein